ncbi:MAG: phage baseplate protein [Acidobacteriota bacterium]
MNEASFSGSSSLACGAIASVESVSPAELLDVWERGQHQAPVERALTMLAAVCPSASRETLAALSIGQRDACLIALRERLFGQVLTSLADCPACGERLEMTFSVLDIRASSKAEPGAMLSFSQSGYELGLRLPNSLDLLALAGCASPGEMRGRLIEQCVMSIRHQGRTESTALTSEMPAEILNAAIEQIAQADPQADVQVDLTCPCCRHEWQAGFDIVSYLWSELHDRAIHLLREIHLLASAYGWRESDILNMSSSRRVCYLEMLAG